MNSKTISTTGGFFLLILFLISCKSKDLRTETPRYTKVSIDTLLQEKMSCRALVVDGENIWFSANNGKYGCVSLKKEPNFLGNITKENLKLEFRSIAQTSKAVFMLSVSNPALLYRIDKKSRQIDLVYEEKHEKVFYDSMIFINELEGFAIGDPTEQCPSFIKTVDGGASWHKIACKGLPEFHEGEAFFAASNTNMNYKNGSLFMVSGGKRTRVFVSKDKGDTWQIFETPIVQGQAMTGAFTSDFYDQNYGIIAGGNYEKLSDNFSNKAITLDGGKTWVLVANGDAFGYASCIQFVPGSKGQCILEAGADGVFYSYDTGNSWQKIANDKDFTAFRFIDSKTVVASGKNRIVKITLQ